MIGAGSDYRKQAQFRALNDFGKSLNNVKVVRDSKAVEVLASDIVVGDVVEVETGMVVPADGILFSGFSVQVDESTMTGEPHAIEKDFVKDPFLLSGTSISNGVGKMLVIATGTNSLNGRSLLALEVEPEDTPLQQKLGRLADVIAKVAFYLAIFMVVLLIIVYFVSNPGASSGLKISQDLLKLLILAVTIVVVAVPEGLPLAVTLSLAHATLQMLKDNNLGIAGTEVSKEAADIILMDDNFASLVRAVVWGRCVFDAIRKFLQFQLTVNISAVIIAIVTAIATTVSGSKSPQSVLTAVQLLWVNLIMDTLAALALATDEPTDALLERAPSKKDEPIVSSEMFLQIVFQAMYQLVVCLVLYFVGPSIWPIDNSIVNSSPVGDVTATLVFNVFIFCQLFNEINCRSISRDKNVFSGILKNRIFVGILLVTIIAQAIIVQFGSIVFGLDRNGLSGANWGISIALGMGSLAVGFLVRLLPPISVPVWLLGGKSLEKKHDLVELSPVVVVIDHVGADVAEKPELKREPSQSAKRWHDAISKTRMQVRVVKLFTLPRDHKDKPPTPRASTASLPMAVVAANPEAPRPSSESWHKLRLYVVTTSMFRRRRKDISQLQMVDPRRVREAQTHQARKSSTQGPRLE
ncbi:hypothetical protein HDU91_005061 [Kappamyces sp. JEL0680]|nr:hypothetical protein HDU91_005061 [Kappamyces sp. JEL0680]